MRRGLQELRAVRQMPRRLRFSRRTKENDGRGETTSCGKRSGTAGSKSRRNGTTRGTTNDARRNGFPRATTSPPRGKIKSGKSLTLPFYHLPRRVANDKPREVSRKIKQQLQHNKNPACAVCASRIFVKLQPNDSIFAESALLFFIESDP